MAVGLRRDFAVNFSFLLSIPAVFGAAILAFIDALRDGIDWSCVPAYLVGTAVALVTGVLSIHLMRYIGKKRRFGGFAYYCWVIGVLSIILYLIF
jgi:undecaprenyl-diphosphatase